MRTDESGIDEVAIADGNGHMARCESHLVFEIAMGVGGQKKEGRVIRESKLSINGRK